MTVEKDEKKGQTQPPADQARPPEELVTFSIDDIETSVPKGTLVIRAAEELGIDIPRFCDHPLLDPAGACRQCMVDVVDDGRGRQMPKPQTSCTLTAMPGMKVRTQYTSPVAEKAQRGMIEFLLINHPLDCPICDKGGECPLQNQAMSTGDGESRYEGEKRTYPKPINISSQVLLDRERCILCARCTRFSEQIAGDPFIALAERGALQQVAIYEKEPFESYFSGNTIQICPVGALTSSAYRFRSRPFDLVSTHTTCENCASGCDLRVDHRRGTVMRRMAGNDPEVNEEWNCDRGRFGFVSGRGDDRITTPLVRRGDELLPASWPEAIDAAVAGLQKAGKDVGVLTGGRLTVEDAYAYSRFARVALGTNNIDFRARVHSAEETDFLASAVAGTGLGVTYADLERAKHVVLVGFEPEDESPIVFLRLRKAMRKKGLKITTIAPFLSRGSQKLNATLVSAVPGGEPQALASVNLDGDAIVLVGERAAEIPGLLTMVLDTTGRSGARMAWIPRRAGERGAVEAGCLPHLLPGGRPLSDPAARVDAQAVWGADVPARVGLDATGMFNAVLAGELGALVVAGVEPEDFPKPRTALEALEEAGFVLSLEARESSVTARADVVLPISLLEERSGTFIDWEGRERPVHNVIPKKHVMTDGRALAALTDALGAPAAPRTVSAAKAEFDEFGPWSGNRAAEPRVAGSTAIEVGPGEAVLSTWRDLLDDSRCLDGEDALLGTAQRPVVAMGPTMAADAPEGALVEVSRGQRSVTLPLKIVENMASGCVWLPAHARGHNLSTELEATAGDLVRLAMIDPEASEGDGPEGAASVSTEGTK